MRAGEPGVQKSSIELNHEYYGYRRLLCDGAPTMLFTENETNTRRLYGDPEGPRYAKDSFHDYVIHGDKEAVNPDKAGSKAAAHYTLTLAPGCSGTIRLRLTDGCDDAPVAGQAFESVFTRRLQEADEFYHTLEGEKLSADARLVQRQAFAGLLWSKQFYHYDVKRWLKGDPMGPSRPVGEAEVAIPIGRISIMPLSSQCPTNGNIPGMRPGI